MEGKFWGAWRVARAAEIKKGGSLTLVSGFLSIGRGRISAIVGAANGAIESLARSLAIDLAPVRVNAVSPGMVDTDIHALSSGEPGRVARIAPHIPMKRAASPGEIATAVLFLLSDEASYITGANLTVSGGR